MLFNSPLYGVFLLGDLGRLLAARRAAPRCRARSSSSSRATPSTSTAPGTRRATSRSRCRLRRVGAPLPRRHLRRQHPRLLRRARARRARQRRAARNALLARLDRLLPGRPRGLQVLELRRRLARVAARARWARTCTSTHLRLVLPFGISFFTFETMSYTIDVWRARARSRRGATSTTCSSSASSRTSSRGPSCARRRCSRSSRRAPRADAAMQARGLWRIATGLGEEDRHRRLPGAGDRQPRLRDARALHGARGARSPSTRTPIQIYADFSGYTDVAIGSAALFGYELPGELRRALPREEPAGLLASLAHLAQHVAARLPLQAARRLARGPSTTYRNLMITMVLGGLWHGASWNFVVWGALHGGALAVTRMWQRARRRARERGRGAWACGPGAVDRDARDVPLRVLRVDLLPRADVRPRDARRSAQLVRGSWTIEHVTPQGGPRPRCRGCAALVAARLGGTRSREAFVRTPALVQGLVLAAAAIGLASRRDGEAGAVRLRPVLNDRARSSSITPRRDRRSRSAASELRSRAHETCPRAFESPTVADGPRPFGDGSCRAALEWRSIAYETRLEAHGRRSIAYRTRLEAYGRRSIAYRTRLEAHGRRSIAYETRLEAHGRRSIAYETRLEAHERRSIAYRTRLEAHERRSIAYRTRLEAHGRRSIAYETRLEAHGRRSIAYETRLEAHGRRSIAYKTRLEAHGRRSIAYKTRSGVSETRLVAAEDAPALCQWPFWARKNQPRGSGTTGVAHGHGAEASAPRFGTDETRARPSRPRWRADRMRPGASARRPRANEARSISSRRGIAVEGT